MIPNKLSREPLEAAAAVATNQQKPGQGDRRLPCCHPLSS